jgi:histone arginine demethylase JMJD6
MNSTEEIMSAVLPPRTETEQPLRVDRRSNISRRELIEEYIVPGRPVVLTDAARAWPAMGKITPEYLAAHYGHLTKEVKGTRYTLAEYVDLMRASTPAAPAPYPFSLNMEHAMPELLAELRPDIVYAKSDRVRHPLLPKMFLLNTTPYELFLGGNGASFPYLHVDALFLHTQITQLYGAKEFFLYPPSQQQYMYPRPDNAKVSQVDVLQPDYAKFPLFRQAQPIVFTVQQGETLIFPTGWWHTTKIHEPCISYGRVHLNAGNWDAFARDHFELRKTKHRAFATAALLYSNALGKVLDWHERGTL